MVSRPNSEAPITGHRVLGLSRTPGHLIRCAQQVHTAIWARRLHGELTGPQYAALVSVAMEPGIDQSRLAQLASLDKNTAAGIVRRLVSQGWIQRSAHPKDRRRHMLELTTPARAALRYITPAAALVQEDLLRPIGADHREAAIDLLATVAQAGAVPGLQDTAGTELPVLPMARTPGYLIRRAQQIHGNIWAQVVGGELTGPQYAVLAALAVQPGADQTALGRLASLDSSTTTEIVARLERSGWLCRASSAAGGRRVSWRFSPAAAERLDVITPLVEEVQAQFLRPLRQVQARRLIDDLALIAHRGEPPRTG